MEVDSGSEGLVSVDDVRSERPGVVDPHPSSLPPLSVSPSSSLPEEIPHGEILHEPDSEACKSFSPETVLAKGPA